MKYTGIDLHSNNSVISVINETDKVVAEKRLPNDLARILEFLEPHKADMAGVVVESTYNWYWVVDGLQEAGYAVHLANTTAIKKYDGLKHSGDETDARHLAHLLRLGILPTGTILPPAHREVRDLARKRMQLIQNRTAQILSIETILSRSTGKRLTSNQIKRLTLEDVPALGLSECVTLALQTHVAVNEVLQQQIQGLEERLQQEISNQDDFKHLMTVPGIGVVLATVIYLETGPIERFAEPGNYTSYARCVGSEHTSNGKKKGQGNTKNGNKYLAWAFVEAAVYSTRFCPQAKRFYERKKAKANTALAVKALAHKLARACYHILKQREPFDMERCFA
jgi:transposase